MQRFAGSIPARHRSLRGSVSLLGLSEVKPLWKCLYTMHKSLQANDADAHFIYDLIKHFSDESMASLSSFTSYYSQRDNIFCNYDPSWS